MFQDGEKYLGRFSLKSLEIAIAFKALILPGPDLRVL